MWNECHSEYLSFQISPIYITSHPKGQEKWMPEAAIFSKKNRFTRLPEFIIPIWALLREHSQTMSRQQLFHVE